MIYETSITNPKKQLEFYKDLSEQLQQENKKLKGSLQTYEILLKANVEENQQLKENQQKLIDYLKEKINITDDFSEELEDEFYIGKTKAYKEILSKIEKE